VLAVKTRTALAAIVGNVARGGRSVQQFAGALLGPVDNPAPPRLAARSEMTSEEELR
jgi:hypothetical protein